MRAAVSREAARRLILDAAEISAFHLNVYLPVTGALIQPTSLTQPGMAPNKLCRHTETLFN